jgi:hypothetical protein
MPHRPPEPVSAGRTVTPRPFGGKDPLIPNGPAISRPAPSRAGNHRGLASLQASDQVGRNADLGGGDVFPEVADAAGARDEQDVGGVLQQPGEPDLRGRDPQRPGGGQDGRLVVEVDDLIAGGQQTR